MQIEIGTRVGFTKLFLDTIIIFNMKKLFYCGAIRKF